MWLCYHIKIPIWENLIDLNVYWHTWDIWPFELVAYMTPTAVQQYSPLQEIDVWVVVIQFYPPTTHRTDAPAPKRFEYILLRKGQIGIIKKC